MANNYLITGYWGEPHVTAENDRGIHAAAFGTGRFVLPVGERFRAEYVGNNTIRMYDGKLMDNGAAAGIPAGEYIDFVIPNAGQGMKRNDLIVFQYEKDSSTLIEKGTFVVLQGTETTGTQSDPEISQEDLLSNDANFDQMALWRIVISGTDIATPECVYEKFYRNKLNGGYYTSENEEAELVYLDQVLEEMGDGENGGNAVSYVIVNRKYAIDQTPQHSWLYRIENMNRNFVRIEATTCLGNGTTMRRVRVSGVWQPWEHLDPGMLVNQEYRTTERWLSKPVYTKLVEYTASSNIGNANSSFGFSVVFSTPNFENLVRYCGTINGTGRAIPCFYNPEEGGGYIGVNFMNQQGVAVEMNKITLSAGTKLAIQVWYTKTTD